MPDQMRSYLDFEKPVAELEAKVDELRALAASGSDIGDEISRIEDKASQALTDLYANLTPWQKTLVARHPQRPHFTDFVNTLMTEFTPMATSFPVSPSKIAAPNGPPVRRVTFSRARSTASCMRSESPAKTCPTGSNASAHAGRSTCTTGVVTGRRASPSAPRQA